MNDRMARQSLWVDREPMSVARDDRVRANSRSAQAQDLLDLAGHVAGILVPVQPAAAWRVRLHRELVHEAQRLQGASASRARGRRRKGVLIGAAAIGSLASVAGVIVAFVLRGRHGRATHAA